MIPGTSPQRAVTSLEIPAYLGRWYQVYGNVVSDAISGFLSCITADYGQNADGTISVLNRGVAQFSLLPKTNTSRSISGYARVPNPANPGELTVRLEGSYIPNFDAPYWVVGLSSKNPVTQKYDWAIVSDPKGSFLYVLARNVAEFFSTYDATVKNELNRLGFNRVFNGYKITPQPSTCQYP